MTEFSIMAPKRRNFLLEWFLRELMNEEGLLGKKYGFLEVSINGNKKGIFTYDEHISKILLERNERKRRAYYTVKQQFSGKKKILILITLEMQHIHFTQLIGEIIIIQPT